MSLHLPCFFYNTSTKVSRLVFGSKELASSIGVLNNISKLYSQGAENIKFIKTNIGYCPSLSQPNNKKVV